MKSNNGMKQLDNNLKQENRKNSRVKTERQADFKDNTANLKKIKSVKNMYK